MCADTNALEPRPGCIETALQVIGDRWTGLILRDLYTEPMRFGQLESSLKDISPRTLSQRLDHLESKGIVKRSAYSQSPTRYEYALTDKGRELSEVVRAMAAWGHKYREQPALKNYA